jgi:hypothetical protein
MKIFISLCFLFIPLKAVADGSEKDWSWGTGEGFAYSATVNNNNHVFGQYCYYNIDTCVYILNTNTNCDDDSKTPVLISSKSGAFSTNLLCKVRKNGKPIMLMGNFDAVDNMVKLDSKFRVAIPMESHKFKVSTFSLRGSNRMIKEMRSFTSKVIENQDKDLKNPESDETFL